MPAGWEQESKGNKFFFIRKPISWGNGANRRRETRKGTYRGSVWGWGEGSGLWEGGEGCRHSEGQAWRSECHGQANLSPPVALLSSIATMSPLSTPDRKTPSWDADEVVWAIGLSRLLLPLSSCGTLKRWWWKNLAPNVVFDHIYPGCASRLSLLGPLLGQSLPALVEETETNWDSGAWLPLLPLRGIWRLGASPVTFQSQPSNGRLVSLAVVNSASVKVPSLM